MGKFVGRSFPVHHGDLEGAMKNMKKNSQREGRVGGKKMYHKTRSEIRREKRAESKRSRPSRY